MAGPSFERRLVRLAGRVLDITGDLVFAPGCLRCHGSGTRAAGVCLPCWTSARPAPATAKRCFMCGEAGGCPCSTEPPPWSWLVTGLDYSGAARDLILLYKFGPEGGRMLLARPLAALLATAVRHSGIGLDVDLVVAVPSHRRRVLERGFDAALLLATRLRRLAGLPAPQALLTRLGGEEPRARGSRRTRPQPEFRLRRPAQRRLQNRRVLLVDDVFTTGTTLRRCCRLLTVAGAAEVRSVVLARTPRRAFDQAVPIV